MFKTKYQPVIKREYIKKWKSITTPTKSEWTPKISDGSIGDEGIASSCLQLLEMFERYFMDFFMNFLSLDTCSRKSQKSWNYARIVETSYSIEIIMSSGLHCWEGWECFGSVDADWWGWVSSTMGSGICCLCLCGLYLCISLFHLIRSRRWR